VTSVRARSAASARSRAWLEGVPESYPSGVALRKSGNRSMHKSKGLERLIAGCLDDERTLEHESGDVDSRRYAVLRRMAGERSQFADRLRTLGEPGARPSPSLSRRLRGGMRWLFVLAGGPNNGDSIAACRRSCDRTEALYTSAIGLPWAQPILSTLSEQRDAIRRSGQELLALQF
jgi:hypothetical protein